MTAPRSLALAAGIVLFTAPTPAQPPQGASSAEAEMQVIEFAFAPPIGTILRYEQVRAGLVDGRPSGARLFYDYSFERREGGYLVWVELTGIEGLGNEQRARLAETVAAPMLNIRYAIELSPDGGPLAIRSEEAVWAATLDGFALIESEMRSRTGIGEEERAQMLGILAAIREQDGALRRNGMLIVIDDLISLAGRTIAIGENPHEDDIASPLGGTVPFTGTISAGLVAEDMAEIEIAGIANTAGQFAIREQVQYRAAPSSGLVHRMERSRAFEARGGAETQPYRETVTIRLIEEIPAGDRTSTGSN
ncbi:hypothetical protein [Parasphingopyxis lamellibrachiae]|uniref:Uncharacterized protein n=1 Tax=Parasphingopyxis lamellibrachiae TaxID=680125 RepID=A0A3D9FE41_9SPHN|nr:hypothetical protein [Parasphingopyxis lamellibrachiae]RED16104.1 hypothetical protein DFR46_1117 [Parasphingopyxis lamellibrachiae]